MGGTIIDIYDNPQKINPVVKITEDKLLDSLSKRHGPRFDEFLKRQIKSENKDREEETEAKKATTVDSNIIASQYAYMASNFTVSEERKKFEEQYKKNMSKLAYSD